MEPNIIPSATSDTSLICVIDQSALEMSQQHPLTVYANSLGMVVNTAPVSN